MLYIVSGFMRSGTSMMMDALSAGGRETGLRCEWSRERDEELNGINGDDHYTPNDSYRELGSGNIHTLEFPKQYDDSLIKIMFNGLSQMRRTKGFHCVFMVRDPFEIAESYARAFGADLPIHENGMNLPATEAKTWPRVYTKAVKTAIIGAELRLDCRSMHVVSYNEVLKSPLQLFTQLESVGWPIDPTIASSIVDPNQKRAHVIHSTHIND